MKKKERRSREKAKKKKKRKRKRGSRWNLVEKERKKEKGKDKKVVWHCYLTVTSQENGSHKFDFFYHFATITHHS